MSGSEDLDPQRLVEEAVADAIEEVKAGHATLIQVGLHADGSCSVQDDGRGIPVAKHGDERSALEVVLCTLHGSDGRSYSVSADLHGKGLSAVNALSEWLEATVWRDGFEWFLRTERAVPVRPTEKRGPSTSRGTRIRFKPTAGSVARGVGVERLARRLGELSALHGGLRIQLNDERP